MLYTHLPELLEGLVCSGIPLPDLFFTQFSAKWRLTCRSSLWVRFMQWLMASVGLPLPGGLPHLQSDVRWNRGACRWALLTGRFLLPRAISLFTKWPLRGSFHCYITCHCLTSLASALILSAHWKTGYSVGFKVKVAVAIELLSCSDTKTSGLWVLHLCN